MRSLKRQQGAPVERKPIPKQVRNRLLAIGGLYLTVLVAIVAYEAPREPNLPIWATVLCTIFVGLCHFTGLHEHFTHGYLTDEMTVDPQLSDMLANDAISMGRKPVKVKIARGKLGSAKLKVDLSVGGVVVSERAASELTRTELRFMLAATTLGAPPWSVIVGFLAIATPLCLGFRAVTKESTLLLPMALVGGVFLLAFAAPRVLRRAMTYNRMEAGLRATLDPNAGASALMKVAGEPQSRKERRELRQKLVALRRAARAQGLPEPSVEIRTNGVLEDAVVEIRS